MFERYTEPARRALFFARYECTQLGAVSIDSEHILLGVARQTQGPVAKILAGAGVSLKSVGAEVADRVTVRPKTSPSVEIPFSPEVKHALHVAADEADRLGHQHIGTEHLVLGLLDAPRSVAGSILKNHGLTIDEFRKTIANLSPAELLGAASSAQPDISISPQIDDLSHHIDQIRVLVEQLANVVRGNVDAEALVDRIQATLEQMRQPLR
jgi:ATP-dependent Clp protease ATP-binding subunit ClpC